MAQFKALIIGAGPSGLMAALALQQAGIDFTILEKREAADLNWGASVCVWPHGVRLLDQLGLLKEAEAVYLPMKKKCNLRGDGSVFSWSGLPEEVKEFHGYDWMLFQRGRLMDVLRNHVSDPEKNLLLEKHVTSIESGPDSVEVTCADGTSYSGSIVIGADGIYSQARAFIDGARTSPAKVKNKDSDKEIYEKGTFKTTYYGVFGCGDSLSSTLEQKVVYETHTEGFCTQLFAVSPEKFMYYVFKKLPNTTNERLRLESKEAADLFALHADTHMAPGVTCKQVWENTNWSFVAPLEEGVANTVNQGRVVLAGDSTMKVTPNLGFGMNTGWQSIVVLTNLLRKLLADKPNPDPEDLTKLFKKYDRLRRGVLKKVVELSALGTRVEAWDNWFWKVSDQYIAPRLGGDSALLKYLVGPVIKEGLVFDFLPEPNLKEGKIKWANKSFTK